jgi:pilus assembly protein Flp/PilA
MEDPVKMQPARRLPLPVWLRSFVRDTRGANMVEYIIVLGVIALAALGAFTTLGNKVKDKVGEESNKVGEIKF